MRRRQPGDVARVGEVDAAFENTAGILAQRAGARGEGRCCTCTWRHGGSGEGPAWHGQHSIAGRRVAVPAMQRRLGSARPCTACLHAWTEPAVLQRRGIPAMDITALLQTATAPAHARRSSATAAAAEPASNGKRKAPELRDPGEGPPTKITALSHSEIDPAGLAALKEQFPTIGAMNHYLKDLNHREIADIVLKATFPESEVNKSKRCGPAPFPLANALSSHLVIAFIATKTMTRPQTRLKWHVELNTSWRWEVEITCGAAIFTLVMMIGMIVSLILP